MACNPSEYPTGVKRCQASPVYVCNADEIGGGGGQALVGVELASYTVLCDSADTGVYYLAWRQMAEDGSGITQHYIIMPSGTEVAGGLPATAVPCDSKNSVVEQCFVDRSVTPSEYYSELIVMNGATVVDVVIIDQQSNAVAPSLPPGAEPCSAEISPAEIEILCDDNGPFMRHVVHGSDGSPESSYDTTLDGATPYTAVGAVSVCDPKSVVCSYTPRGWIEEAAMPSESFWNLGGSSLTDGAAANYIVPATNGAGSLFLGGEWVEPIDVSQSVSGRFATTNWKLAFSRELQPCATVGIDITVRFVATDVDAPVPGLTEPDAFMRVRRLSNGSAIVPTINSSPQLSDAVPSVSTLSYSATLSAADAQDIIFNIMVQEQEGTTHYGYRVYATAAISIGGCQVEVDSVPVAIACREDEFVAAPLVMCDNAGEEVVHYMLHVIYDNRSGLPVRSATTLLDGVSPYLPVGPVALCADAPTVVGPRCIRDGDGVEWIAHDIITSDGELVSTVYIDTSGQPGTPSGAPGAWSSCNADTVPCGADSALLVKSCDPSWSAIVGCLSQQTSITIGLSLSSPSPGEMTVDTTGVVASPVDPIVYSIIDTGVGYYDYQGPPAWTRTIAIRPTTPPGQYTIRAWFVTRSNLRVPYEATWSWDGVDATFGSVAFPTVPYTVVVGEAVQHRAADGTVLGYYDQNGAPISLLPGQSFSTDCQKNESLSDFVLSLSPGTVPRQKVASFSSEIVTPPLAPNVPANTHAITMYNNSAAAVIQVSIGLDTFIMPNGASLSVSRDADTEPAFQSGPGAVSLVGGSFTPGDSVIFNYKAVQ